jgi:hypothetical protein
MDDLNAITDFFTHTLYLMSVYSKAESLPPSLKVRRDVGTSFYADDLRHFREYVTLLERAGLAESTVLRLFDYGGDLQQSQSIPQALQPLQIESRLPEGIVSQSAAMPGVPSAQNPFSHGIRLTLSSTRFASGFDAHYQDDLEPDGDLLLFSSVDEVLSFSIGNPWPFSNHCGLFSIVPRTPAEGQPVHLRICWTPKGPHPRTIHDFTITLDEVPAQDAADSARWGAGAGLRPGQVRVRALKSPFDHTGPPSYFVFKSKSRDTETRQDAPPTLAWIETQYYYDMILDDPGEDVEGTVYVERTSTPMRLQVRGD